MKTQKENIAELINLILKAVGLAMGVAAVVLSIMDAAELETIVLLLGFGLFGTAVGNLDQKQTA